MYKKKGVRSAGRTCERCVEGENVCMHGGGVDIMCAGECTYGICTDQCKYCTCICGGRGNCAFLLQIILQMRSFKNSLQHDQRDTPTCSPSSIRATTIPDMTRR